MKLVKVFIPVLLLFFMFSCQRKPLRFAHVTDTHIGSSTSAGDLMKTVNDINSLSDIDFVLFTGDITEFGSDAELLEAKEIISKLNKPWYIVPGNHDSKWSESGCNSFVKVFGSETFCFEKGGFLFLGTASGPDMRMGPGLVPRDQMVFIDSVLTSMKDKKAPVIFVNHYPLDESLANNKEVLAMLKTRNTQVSLLGHGHRNKLFDFEGIPGVMGRSNLQAHEGYPGYNIVTIENDTLYYQERASGKETLPVWCKIPLEYKEYRQEPIANGMDSINSIYPGVTVEWQFQEKSGIGTGTTLSGNYAAYATMAGEVVVLDASNGKEVWRNKTGGKIFSIPAISGKKLVCPSTDGAIYCFDLGTGKKQWTFETQKSIVASPVIDSDVVYCGASDGIFRAIDLDRGKLVWQFDSVNNFVETRPLVYEDMIYFGSWGNSFYALDKNTGKRVWSRKKYTNRMLSPAAVWPVAANGKVFIVAPDRHMTALDAKTGKEIWDSGKYTCRESIGMSADGELVYIKNMTEGNFDAFYTNADEQKLAWECKAELGYEISPSPITGNKKLIFVPTASGEVCAISKKTHQLAWKHKISYAIINYVCPYGEDKVLLTSLDGKVVCLKF